MSWKFLVLNLIKNVHGFDNLKKKHKKKYCAKNNRHKNISNYIISVPGDLKPNYLYNYINH